MEGPSKRETGLDLIAITLVAILLFGTLVALYVIMAPHLFGSWREALAPVAVALAAVAIEIGLGRAFLRPLSGAMRLLIAAVVGATLGLLWGLIAGHVTPWKTAILGVTWTVFITSSGMVGRAWKRRTDAQAPSA